MVLLYLKDKNGLLNATVDIVAYASDEVIIYVQKGDNITVRGLDHETKFKCIDPKGEKERVICLKIEG